MEILDVAEHPRLYAKLDSTCDGCSNDLCPYHGQLPCIRENQMTDLTPEHGSWRNYISTREKPISPSDALHIPFM